MSIFSKKRNRKSSNVVKNKSNKNICNQKRTPKYRKIHKQYRGGEDGNEEECSICLRPLGNENVVRCANNHGFHKECIYPFFQEILNRPNPQQRSLTCPNCRVEMQQPVDLPVLPSPPIVPEDIDPYLEPLIYVVEFYTMPNRNSSSYQVFVDANKKPLFEISEGDRDMIIDKLIEKIKEYDRTHNNIIGRATRENQSIILNKLNFDFETPPPLFSPESGFRGRPITNQRYGFIYNTIDDDPNPRKKRKHELLQLQFQMLMLDFVIDSGNHLVLIPREGNIEPPPPPNLNIRSSGRIANNRIQTEHSLGEGYGVKLTPLITINDTDAYAGDGVAEQQERIQGKYQARNRRIQGRRRNEEQEPRRR